MELVQQNLSQPLPSRVDCASTISVDCVQILTKEMFLQKARIRLMLLGSRVGIQ